METQRQDNAFAMYFNNIDLTLKEKGINNFIDVFVESHSIGLQVIDGFINKVSYEDMVDQLYNFLVKG